MTEREQTITFLEQLFSAKEDGHHLLIWTAKVDHSKEPRKWDKYSRWFFDLEKAADAAQRLKEHHEVYFGVGLGSQSGSPYERVKASQVVAIPGLWVDFDLKGGAHKKQNLPETLEEIEELISEAGLAPTLRVHSGHGLQCYWLFKELWLFQDAEDRGKASRRVQGWLAHIQRLAGHRGWDVDAANDLARVLRLPGTLNHKVKDAVQEVSLA